MWRILKFLRSNRGRFKFSISFCHVNWSFWFWIIRYFILLYLLKRHFSFISRHTKYNFQPSNRLARYKHIQQINLRFWKRFSTEYISQLDQSYKWSRTSIYPREGTLLLIKDARLPSRQLDRTIKTLTSLDNHWRVAEVRTSIGNVIRSVRLQLPLPLENN